MAKTFRLIVTSVPRDPQGDLIRRTYVVRARDWDEAMYFSTVFHAIPGSMDNVIDWHVTEIKG